MEKIIKSIRIDPTIFEWIQKKIEDKTYRNLSHCIDVALFELQNRKNDQNNENKEGEL